MHQRVTILRAQKEKRTGEYSNDSKTMSIRSDKARMTDTGPITNGNGERARARKPMKSSKRSDLESTANGRTSKGPNTSIPMWSIGSKTTVKMINALKKITDRIRFGEEGITPDANTGSVE